MKKTVLLLFMLASFFSQAQKVEYKVLFNGIGDNREYANSGKAYSQTILGGRGAFELGVSFDKHRLMGGFSHLLEYGSDIDDQKAKLTLYYQYSDKQKDFLFGAFPRRGRINFPLAMLTDTLQYYRPNIEGVFGEVRWDWGHQNAFVDWVSRQTETKRENFMVGASGEIFYKNLFLQNYILMFHDANTAAKEEEEHLKDYVGYAIQAGIRTNKKASTNGYIKAGILNSYYRERHVSNGFENALSFFAELQGRYKNVGIKSVLNAGDGHKFKYGDKFYQQKNYLRTDFIWYFINSKQIKGKFNYSLHLVNWEDIDHQQQLSIIYVFGGKIKKK